MINIQNEGTDHAQVEFKKDIDSDTSLTVYSKDIENEVEVKLDYKQESTVIFLDKEQVKALIDFLQLQIL